MRIDPSNKTKQLLGVAAAWVAMSSPAYAESFALNEHSARDLGRASAGAVVQVEDASAAFANPALMTLYRRPMVTMALSGVAGASERFHNYGSVDLLGEPLDGNAEDFLVESVIPALHLVYPVNRRLALGLSIGAPFGLSTSYDSNWAGRYQALDSELTVVNVSPSVAYQVADTLSVGIGFDIQYSDAKLSNAIDFGAVCFGTLGPSSCVGLGLSPQMADGRAVVAGNDWSFGYNLGLAWTPNERWRVGLAYRSEIAHELEGHAEITVPEHASILTTSGAFSNTQVRAQLNLPASLEAGVMWRANERTTLYGSVRERYWSSLEEIRVEFANPLQPDAVDVVNYGDARRYSAGVDFEVSDQWVVRAGFALDETPTDAANRLARIADNTRRYYALGASWTGSQSWQVDIGYNWIDIDESEFDRVGDYGERLRGRFEGGANVLSIGATYKFGSKNARGVRG